MRDDPSHSPDHRGPTTATDSPSGTSSMSSAAHAAPDVRSDPALPRWVTWAFVVNLVVEIGIVVTGGLVRLTGSGLGCPTWPQCTPGRYTPVVKEATSYHIFVEFGNRLLTFVLVAAAAAVVLAILRHLRHRRGFLLPAAALVLGIVAQAVIGGISVRVDLHPAWVLSHFLVSALLIALSVYLLVRLREGDGPAVPLVPDVVRALAMVTAAVGAVVVVLGTVVTGSGPHSGDAEKPMRLGFAVKDVAWLHADAVLLFVGLTVAVWLAARLTSTARRPRRAWELLGALTVVQGVVGYTQFALGVPEALVLVHMLLAALFVAALTNAVLALRHRHHA